MREGEITGEVGGETGVEITQQNIMKFGPMSHGVQQPMATEATIDTAALAAAKRKEFTRTMIELAGMLPVLIVICILFAVLTPNFLTQNNMVNVVRQASINIVLAAGMTFVILTGGIDLAVGSVLGFTAVIAVVVSLIPGLSALAVPAALCAGLLVGVLTGATVAYIGLPPFIVTLGSLHGDPRASLSRGGGDHRHQQQDRLRLDRQWLSGRFRGWSLSLFSPSR